MRRDPFVYRGLRRAITSDVASLAGARRYVIARIF